MSIIGAFILPHPPLIIPEIGGGKEAKIQKTIDSCKEIARRIDKLSPESIIIISPHSICYSDYIHVSPGVSAKGDFSAYGASNVKFEANYDNIFSAELDKISEENDLRAGLLGEHDPQLDHGTMLPLYFLNQYLQNYKIVRIGVSGLAPTEHYKLGKLIAEVAQRLDRKTVLLASGDLSHKLKDEGPYGYSENGVEFDIQITKAMADGDFYQFLNFSPDFCEAACECGLRSFIVMAGALDGKKIDAELLSYEGPFGVGYGAAAYSIIGDDSTRHFDKIFEENQEAFISELKKNESPHVKLARATLEHYVTTGKELKITADMVLPENMLKNRAGVFVSLKKYGQLRGCIGTICPVTDCIADEILRNAICAGAEDTRFHPVELSELKELVYSVDVLGTPEKISSASSLDVKKYGVIVSKGSKRGLLLPNLDGVTTVTQQISIAKQKSGISEDQEVNLERFEVIRYK